MSTAQERLQQGYYNSAAVSGANPGGLASGGHVQNFPAALADIGAVAQTVGTQSAAAVGAAGSAQASASSAHDDRVLAQQAASAAGQFDANAYVRKSGGEMTGPLTVPAVLRVKAQDANVEGGEIRLDGAASYPNWQIDVWTGRIRLWTASGVASGLNFDGAVARVGDAPLFSSGNDGSGSGLDADMVRGLVPNHEATPTTLVARDGNGSGHFKDVVITLQAYWSNGAWLAVDGDGLKLNRALYMDSSLSASELRQRSDQRLKDRVESLEVSNGRLRPVRYRLKSTNRIMIGFLAQDVERVRPEAVREGEAEDALVAGERPILDLEPMALIAHLAAQVNALQDRLDAAGL